MKAKNYLIAAIALVASSTLMAQTTSNNNYSDQAYEQTKELATALNLTDEQTMVVLDINQKYADLVDYIATNSQLSKKGARKATKNLEVVHAEEIKSVLDDNQKEKFENMVSTNEALAPQFTTSLFFDSATQTLYFSSDAPYFSR